MPKHPRAEPITMNQRYINIIVHGDPGCGKTVLAGTSQRALIMNADIGTESAAIQNTTAEEVPLLSWDDMDEHYEYFRSGGGCKAYDWVWMDSVSLFQELGMAQIMEELVLKFDHRDPDVPDRGEYLKNMNRLKKYVRHFAALPINFGITAHSFKDEDDDGNVRYMPWIQGKNMPATICGWMGIVGHMDVRPTKSGGVVRVMYTEHHGKYYAKDRFDALGGKVVNPTIPKIEKLVAGVLPSPQPPTRRASATGSKKTTRKKTTGTKTTGRRKSTARRTGK